MDRPTAIFVEGMGTAAATSGVLTQLQGRIFALLYLRAHPQSLDDIATELQQSKSNISVNVRGLVDWRLVRRVQVPRSRKDHYDAATDFWQVMQEIMERRFRWNLRQVMVTVHETREALAGRGARSQRGERLRRLEALDGFAAAVDAAIRAFGQGEPIEPHHVQRALEAVPIEDGPG